MKHFLLWVLALVWHSGICLGQSGVITTVAGGGPRDGALATQISIGYHIGIATDATGNFYIASVGSNRVFRVAPSGAITIVAGNGTIGSSGDGGPATEASVRPVAVTVDAAGNMFIAEQYPHDIRKVTPSGVIATLAKPSLSGLLYNVAVDSSGDA